MIWIDFMSWIKHMTLIQFIHWSKIQMIIINRTINNFKYTSWYPFIKMCSSNEPILATIWYWLVIVFTYLICTTLDYMDSNWATYFVRVWTLWLLRFISHELPKLTRRMQERMHNNKHDSKRCHFLSKCSTKKRIDIYFSVFDIGVNNCFKLNFLDCRNCPLKDFSVTMGIYEKELNFMTETIQTYF